MTQEQQAFCCRVKGTGCADKVYASNMSTVEYVWSGPDLPSSYYVDYGGVQYIIIPMPWRNVVANPREFTARFLTTIAVSILADPDYPGDPDDLDDLVFSSTVLMIFPVSRDVNSPSTEAISEAIVLKDPWRGSDTLSNRLRQVKKVRELLPSNVSDSLVPTKLQALRQANMSDNIAVVFTIHSNVTKYSHGSYSSALVYSRSELYMRNNEGYTYIRTKLTGVSIFFDAGTVYPVENPPVVDVIPPPYSPSTAESATKWILLGSGAGLVAAGLLFCAVYKWRAAKRCAHQSPLLGAAGGENGPDFELNSYASDDSQQEKSRIVVEEGEL
ncbi:hypothetical protein DIPPA_23955 [Diplonema papillatum]|nr:hypothetical protein DIPPA_23955 [Diplonema papillatum]